MPTYKSVRGAFVNEEEEAKLSEFIKTREEEYLKALGLLKEKEALDKEKEKEILEEQVDAKAEQEDQLESSGTEGVSEEKTLVVQESTEQDERETETPKRGRRRK